MTEEIDNVIYQALVEARDAVLEWQTSRKFTAEGSDRHNVQAQRLRAEHGVFAVIEHLRPYLIDKIPDMWHGFEDTDDWLFFDDEKREGLPGLQAVLAYRGRVSTTETVVETHDGYENQSVSEADMLPPECVEEALSWSSTAAYKLGFLPDSDGKRKTYNVSTGGATEPDREPELEDAPSDADTEDQPADD
jgi:hypothetical protein